MTAFSYDQTAARRSPLAALTGRALWAFAAITSLAIGLWSLRYVMPEPYLGSPGVLANPFAPYAIALHAGGGSIALILGAFQFVRRKGGQGRAPWHRWSGALYMASCLVSAPAGLLLAFGSTSGPIATAGFGTLAVVWFYVNVMGLRAIVGRRYAEHGRWMVRSYALTFGAVTLRLMLLGGALLHLDPLHVYLATSFLAWVPNLMVTETWFALRRFQTSAGAA